MASLALLVIEPGWFKGCYESRLEMDEAMMVVTNSKAASQTNTLGLQMDWSIKCT